MEQVNELKRMATLQEELHAAREHIKTLEGLQNLKNAELNAANRSAEKARYQLELLREMYYELLDRMTHEE